MVLTSSQGFCGISAIVNAYVFMSMSQFISAWPDVLEVGPQDAP